MLSSGLGVTAAGIVHETKCDSVKLLLQACYKSGLTSKTE